MNNGQAVTPTWLRQVATALSSRYSVAVREGRGWSMDVEKRVLTYKPDHLLALDRDTCLGILLHEIGHLHHSTNDWQENAKYHKNGKHPLANITFENVNAFEDVRINEKMSQSYGGSRELIDAMNELTAGDSIKMLRQTSEALRSGRPRDKVTQLTEHEEITYISMLHLMGLVPQDLLDNYYDQHKRKLVEDIVNDAKSTYEVKSMLTTQEVADFVENYVFPRLKPYLPPTAKNPTPQSGDGESGEEEEKDGGTSKTGDGENEENEASKNSEADGQQEASDGKNSEADGEKGENEKSDSDSTKGADQDKDKDGEPTSKAGDGFGLDKWKKDIERKIQQAIRRGRINPDAEHRTEPFDKRRTRPQATSFRQEHDVDMHIADSKTLQSQFANKFASLFRDNQYKRETRNQRSGRIDKRSLYKFPQGKQRLFKRKLDINRKDYAVAFLQDVSGSMDWTQLQGSYHAMLAFSTTLDKLGIPYGMGFFGGHSRIAKNFAERQLNTRKASIEATTAGANSTEPSGLLQDLCGHQLAKLNVQEKIVVILTDGQWSRHNYDELHKLKKNNPEMHVYVVALGMGNYVEDLQEILGKSATLLVADEPHEVVTNYIEVARRHLL